MQKIDEFIQNNEYRKSIKEATNNNQLHLAELLSHIFQNQEDLVTKVTKIPLVQSVHTFCLSHDYNCSRNTAPQVLSFSFFFVRSWRTPIHFILLFFVGPRPQQTHNSINKYEHCPRTHRPIGHGFPSS